jgi:hypothetical protein
LELLRYLADVDELSKEEEAKLRCEIRLLGDVEKQARHEKTARKDAQLLSDLKVVREQLNASSHGRAGDAPEPPTLEDLH